MRLRNILSVLCLGVLAMTTAACGQTVNPGNAGVKIKKFGGGVVQEPLRSGWHGTGPGEEIVQYPTIQRTYAYTREVNEEGDENEEIAFTDARGLPMTADVSITLKVADAVTPALYVKYRLTFDELLDGPIRNDVRAAIASETEKVSVDQLLAGGRQVVIRKAFATVARKWSREGVTISQMDWIGTIRFPDVILASIQARAKADQQVLAANAQVAVAEAQAKEKVAIAQGNADANRIMGEALASNPQVLKQQELNRWKGLCPFSATTCIIGGDATALVQ